MMTWPVGTDANKLLRKYQTKYDQQDQAEMFTLINIQNLKNMTDDLSDYQIAVYTYILNFKNFSIRFSNLNQRFH